MDTAVIVAIVVACLAGLVAIKGYQYHACRADNLSVATCVFIVSR